MKKSIFTLCCTLFFILPLSVLAQPDTITAQNASISNLGVETDTITTVTMPGAVFPDFSARPFSYTWDMTAMGYSSIHTISHSAGVSPYQYSDSVGYTLGPWNYFVYEDNFYVGDGRRSHQQHTDVDQNDTFPRLDTFTFHIVSPPHDSVVHIHDTAFISFSAQQNWLYGPGTNQTLTYHFVMPFPTTLNTTWSSDYHVKHAFTIKDTDPSMHCTSVTGGNSHTRYITESNTVIGYGNMKINTVDSDIVHHILVPSRLYRVLQVKVVKTYHDVISLASSIDTRLFDSIGMKSSYTQKIYEQDFYTTQLMSPLARVIFTDSTMTVVKSAEINVGNLSGIDLNVQILNNDSKTFIYPNPVVNGQLFIELAHTTEGNWSYELSNISGQILGSGLLPINSNNTKAMISLPTNIVPGMYFIQISNNGNRQSATPVLISK